MKVADMTMDQLASLATYLECTGREPGAEDDLLLALRIRLGRLLPEDRETLELIVEMQLEDAELERLQAAN